MTDEDVLQQAARELYALAPDDFLARRKELADAARQDSDAATAQAIAKLRKPTVAAWIVNALTLADASVYERVVDLGDRLRAAQHKLDAATLRAMTNERRSLVAELTKQALAQAGRKDPTVGLRDEVHGSFDAAVADPDVAARLGTLQRAESFSGFGFDASGGPPQLTLVRGGKTDAAPDEKRAEPAKPSPKEARAHKRELARAQRDFDDAETTLHTAQHDESAAKKRVKDGERALSAAKEALESARRELDDARVAVREASARRRETRRALDRAERA